MGESAVGVSVSFGKYENDAASLSWEKWSAFSPNNKYLEEVGKCSTPGSVAQKKAFFEAHYKKIAAMKAAEAADLQENSTSDDDQTFQAQINEEPQTPAIHGYKPVNDESLEGGDVLIPSQSPIAYTTSYAADKLEEEEEEAVLVNDETSMKQVGDVLPPPVTLNTNAADKLEEAVLFNDKTSMKQVGDVLPPPVTLDNNAADKLEEAVIVNDETSMKQVGDVLPTLVTLNTHAADKLDEALLVNNESMKLVKQHFQVDLEIQDPQEHRPKQKAQYVTPKINPHKVDKSSIGMKKKPASLLPKSPETPGSRLSKPKPKVTSSSSMKKASAPLSASSSSKNKYPSVSESRHVAPMSLHLSMSMNSVNSDTASSVTSSRRRSLFMEQMGDKDIVKRAFKTFQNRVNQLPSYDTGPKKLPTKRPELKTSTSGAYQKENERSRKVAEKINPARGQLGPTWKSLSSGSPKEVGVDERRLKAGPTSLVFKSNERAERRKEFFKNLEEKSNAREAERSQLSLKSKEVKDAEMKKLKQNLNLKAKRVPSSNQSQGALKITSHKETIKSGTTG